MREVVAMIGWARILKTARYIALAGLVIFLPLLGFCFFIATGKGNSIGLVLVPLTLYPVLILLITWLDLLRLKRDYLAIKCECDSHSSKLISMQAQDGGYLVRCLTSGSTIESFCIVRKHRVTWNEWMDNPAPDAPADR